MANDIKDKSDKDKEGFGWEDIKLTGEQKARIKKARFFFQPFRLVYTLIIFSLLGAGPKNFIENKSGLFFSIFFFLVWLVDLVFQPVELGGKREDRGSFFVLRGAFFTSYSIAIIDHFWLQPRLWFLDLPGRLWSYILVGAIFVMLGQIMRLTAIRKLGRFFTYGVRVQDDHRLITSGLYSIVRHPAYTGLLFSGIGFVIMFKSVPGLFSVIVLGLLALHNRMSIEERALSREFKEEYKEYRKRTKKIIPFIY
ncbi:MAG: isoprenylcysteine carboxylmethyltransferase family protein [Deltaproteobacteria bacterium]|nr:isoprenylcysteine carboxylmethyltransferase family protein [Deltaproteobacteria bacterium]